MGGDAQRENVQGLHAQHLEARDLTFRDLRQGLDVLMGPKMNRRYHHGGTCQGEEVHWATYG